MTRKLGGVRRGMGSGFVSAILAAGLAVGAAGAADADPSLVPTPAPQPTVSLEGGAAPADAATTADTATASGSATAARPATAAGSGNVLDQLAEQYAVGVGGGQLSKLLNVSLKLQAMGFKPSKPYLDEITTAMSYRPNQIPLISALKTTIAYQQKIRAQTQVLQQAQSRQNAGSAVMGAGQMPGDSNPAGAPGAPSPVAPAPLPAAP